MRPCSRTVACFSSVPPPASHPSTLPVWKEAPPRVALTDVKVMNKRALLGERGSPLEVAASQVAVVQLKPEHTIFAFTFSALSYRASELQYAYRLDGFDTSWIHTGTDRVATYTASWRVRVSRQGGQRIRSLERPCAQCAGNHGTFIVEDLVGLPGVFAWHKRHRRSLPPSRAAAPEL